MSQFHAIEWALDQPLRSASAKLILALLARAGAAEGVTVSMAVLAEQAGVDRATVRRNLRYLEDKGLVSCVHSYKAPSTFTLCGMLYAQ